MTPCLQTFWHSSSHILGEALESSFGVDLTIGPAIEEGFYYDCFLEDGRTLGEADKPTIEKRIQEVSQEQSSWQGTARCLDLLGFCLSAHCSSNLCAARWSAGTGGRRGLLAAGVVLSACTGHYLLLRSSLF